MGLDLQTTPVTISLRKTIKDPKMSASESSETYSPSSPSSEGSHGYSIDEKSRNAFSTLEVVPPSNLEHYRRVSEVQRSFYPNWMSSGHGIYTKYPPQIKSLGLEDN